MEEYAGLTLFDALADLDAKGLTYEVVGSGNNIVNQAPHGGTEVNIGSKVLIYVEQGEGESGSVVVPDVSGKTYEEAKSAIEAQGLTVYTESQEGVVDKTEPAYGISLEEGAQVTLIMTDESGEQPEEGQEGSS